jgi:two-component system, chemotaxis family, chemotaxis protein CheY
MSDGRPSIQETMVTTVMIADDSMLVRQQVKRALVGAGFAVIEAVDGADALQKVAESDLALVVCDVNMPRMSGIEFLERLRDSEIGKDLPVVMLTTEGQPELIQRAQSLGAKGWIIKPFKPELLVAAAKKLTGVL